MQGSRIFGSGFRVLCVGIRTLSPVLLASEEASISGREIIKLSPASVFLLAIETYYVLLVLMWRRHQNEHQQMDNRIFCST